MNRCHCTEQEVNRYRGRISGPLLDRIDLSVTTTRVSYEMLAKKRRRHEKTGTIESGSSEVMREQVRKAWEIQQCRYREEVYKYNGRVPAVDLQKWCTLTPAAEESLKLSYERLGLSARAYHRVLRVARTIADLEGTETIEEKQVMEAIGYRGAELK